MGSFKFKREKINKKMSMEEEICISRVSEQAERFDDMVDFLNQVITKKDPKEFNNEERNLFSVGFKNQIGIKRTAIRTINAIKDNPKYSKYGDALNEYKKKIEEELYTDCTKIIETVKSHCISTSDQESKAFFQKMIGDYYRYVAENASEDKLPQLGEEALQEALDKIDECDEETFRDAKSIIELLNE